MTLSKSRWPGNGAIGRETISLTRKRRRCSALVIMRRRMGRNFAWGGKRTRRPGRDFAHLENAVDSPCAYFGNNDSVEIPIGRKTERVSLSGVNATCSFFHVIAFSYFGVIQISEIAPQSSEIATWAFSQSGAFRTGGIFRISGIAFRPSEVATCSFSQVIAFYICGDFQISAIVIHPSEIATRPTPTHPRPSYRSLH